MEINTWKKTPGLMLYFNDWEMPRKILNAQNFKEFFDAVFNYAQSGEIPSPLSDGTAQIFLIRSYKKSMPTTHGIKTSVVSEVKRPRKAIS